MLAISLSEEEFKWLRKKKAYEGGKNGGEIIAKGTPEEIIKNKKSFTAKFLKKELS